jgi:hypothetical protein
MNLFLGVEDLNTRSCHLEDTKIFGSTKRKLDLPPDSEHDSHHPNKVNYSILHMNTRSTRARMEGALSNPSHGIAHTTSILETDCNIGHLP